MKSSDKFEISDSDKEQYQKYVAENYSKKRLFDDGDKYMMKNSPIVFSDSPTPFIEIKETKYSYIQYFKDTYSTDNSENHKYINEAVKGQILFPHAICLHCIIETSDDKILAVGKFNNSAGRQV